MYDRATSELIQSTPDLPELDREALPDKFSRAFAEIVSARVLLREVADDPTELIETIDFAQRLAHTNEALVSIDPERENRAAASFVAATAYQLVYQATALREPQHPDAFLDPGGISPDISAMLLFLIADASADAAEVARSTKCPRGERLQSELIRHLIMLAQGQVGKITESNPKLKTMVEGEGAERANAALYYHILRGVHALAFMLQGQSADPLAMDPLAIFAEVKALAAPGAEENIEDLQHAAIAVFPGPFHLASLLIAAGKALLEGAVVNLPPPDGVPKDHWRDAMKSVAKTRPYLWRNHKEAAAKGYLANGTSSAIGFPTGSGKSTTAQLKIHAVLLSGRRVIFLAPTHALVDQTSCDLRSAFPRDSVQGERVDEFGFSSADEDLPDIMVMTPEACLLFSHRKPERFEGVGLLIFDECHIIHPKKYGYRRAIDAMLCILGFVRVAPKADVLLLSAMMKNTEELSAWLTELTGREALALDNAWKPTRQLRGCIVYDLSRLDALKKILREERLKNPKSVSVPAAVRHTLTAQPSAFFSVKQTWESKVRCDYALVPLLNDALTFATNKKWDLTPNSGVTASSIAAAAAKAGLRTLIFSQSIPNAVSIAKRAATALDDCEVELTEVEQRAYDIAVDEMGGADQLYLTLKDGKLAERAGTHHGQLLPEERQIVESLYKRANALSVLAATPTLGQGMNLPADVVIIAEDSQYDEGLGRRDILKPEELLNAAGRAGRAGESSTGIVLVIPGQVVGFDDTDNRIGSHWPQLREIFRQSDQCLVLDDPFTAVMDRIHNQTSEIGDPERYVVARLAETEEGEDGKRDVRMLARSFAAFRKRQAGDEDWVKSRTASALSLLNKDTDDDAVDKRTLLDLASILGMPEEILQQMSGDVVSGLAEASNVADCCDWIFSWLLKHPAYMARLLKSEDVEYLFGKEFKDLKDDADKAKFAIPKLSAALTKWMDGEPLLEIQKELSETKKNLKRSTSARKFVIRMVPDLAHLMSAPLEILRRQVNQGKDELQEPSPALVYANCCVRWGYLSAEMAAYSVQSRTEQWSRRKMHRRFANIAPYLSDAPDNETLAALEARVKAASDKELIMHL